MAFDEALEFALAGRALPWELAPAGAADVVKSPSSRLVVSAGSPRRSGCHEQHGDEGSARAPCNEDGRAEGGPDQHASQSCGPDCLVHSTRRNGASSR